MKKVFVSILIVLNICSFGHTTIVPKDFQILEEKIGDLDRDGINEKVIVYNTSDTTEDGIIRELAIFKSVNNKWNLWKKSRSAILKSQEGGMMGDPFSGIDIIKGLLIVHLSGGSSWKWNYTDKYRFQNGEFELIGYSSYYGKLCEYWEDFDFNLLSGKIILKKEYEDCDKNQQIYKRENETFYKKGISITINNRTLNKYRIISPKFKHELFL